MIAAFGVTGVTGVGTSGVRSSRNNCWNAGTRLVVGDEVCARLLGDRGSCDGVQHALINVVDHSEYEGQTRIVGLALCLAG